MKEELDQISKGIGKVLETTPELYHDAFQSSAQESGKLISRIPRAINAAFAGLDKWILNREYSIEETKKLLAVKLEKIDPEKIVEPEPYVAVPAIQAISYTMNSNELRNLYANLLSKSMIIDTKDSVHPSFVEIIKQMSPIDACVFQQIMNANLRPLIDLRKKSANNNFILFQSHCSWIRDFTINQSAASIDNLIRLGLIEIPYGTAYSDDQAYNNVKQNPRFIDFINLSESFLNPDETFEYNKRYIEISSLSTLFYNICSLDP